MSKKLKLQVPVPCHEDWEKMTNAEKGRFCSSCRKTVIDFSNMSDREIALFFKRPSTGSMCGRFMDDQLNRDIEIPKKRIPWIKYFFHFLFPGFLISMKATAQGKVRVIEKETRVPVKSLRRTSDRNAKYTGSKCTITQGVIAPVIVDPMRPICEEESFHGKVVDENGNPVPFATVTIKDTKTGTAADSNGVFSLTPENRSDSIFVVATAVGFSSTETLLYRALSISNSIILKATDVIMGEVVITRPANRYRTGMVMSVKTISINEKTFTPVMQHHLKIHPNPMQRGSTLHVGWDQKELGDHSVQLYNQTGQLVFRKEIYIDRETRVLSIDLPSLSAGNYFLSITSKGTPNHIRKKL